LKGIGKGKFVSVKNKQVGLRINGQVRAMKLANTARGSEVVVVKNNDNAQVIHLKK
jgi:hypothetical protein